MWGIGSSGLAARLPNLLTQPLDHLLLLPNLHFHLVLGFGVLMTMRLVTIHSCCYPKAWTVCVDGSNIVGDLHDLQHMMSRQCHFMNF
jgi:hypothetical protein